MENKKERSEFQEERLIRYQFFGIAEDPFTYFLPEDLQLEMVRRNKDNIIFINDPTEKVIKEAFDGDLEKGLKELEPFIGRYNEYKYLNEATEEVQLAEVSKDERMIEYIKNPSKKVQLAALDKWYGVVRFIRNPTEKVQKIAISNDIDSLSDLRFITPIEKTIEILKEKLSNPRVRKKYVIKFLQCNYIIGDKLEFINRYGSNKAKRLGMELWLSGFEMVTEEGHIL